MIGRPRTLRRFDLVRPDAVLAAYDGGGDGVPILFQHGLCGAIGQVAEAVPPDGFRLVGLECRGHGASSLSGPYKIATFAEDVLALAAHLGLKDFILGGISMGAAIASHIAVRRPELLRALVLARPAWIAAAGPDTLAPNAEVGRLLAAHPPDEARALFEAGPTHAVLAREAPDNLASLMSFFTRQPARATADVLCAIAADGPDVSEADLKKIDLPCLVLGTQADAIHPMAYAQALARLIPGARLVRLTPKGIDKNAYLADFHAALGAFAHSLSAAEHADASGR